jgi:glutamyl-tRNA synthetase
MGVTHVIRGDDHLNNAFRQLALIRAMATIEPGWDDPVYAHIPLIHGADGAKLSKRHGALGVDAYRDEMGLLPEAVENYLLRLGWGHGDDEIISRAQAIEWFDLAGVGRSPSRFDIKKLENVNGHYIRASDDARLVALITPGVATAIGRDLTMADRDLLHRTMAELKKRANNLNELTASCLFLLRTRPIPMDDAASKLLASADLALVRQARTAFAAVDDWQVATLESAARALAEGAGVKLGQVAQPLRAAMTGAAQSPGLFDVMAVLGQNETLGRIDDALARIEAERLEA